MMLRGSCHLGTPRNDPGMKAVSGRRLGTPTRPKNRSCSASVLVHPRRPRIGSSSAAILVHPEKPGMEAAPIPLVLFLVVPFLVHPKDPGMEAFWPPSWFTQKTQ
ncbi:hypothetical protein FKM82_027518 [Ascaphus truei]